MLVKFVSESVFSGLGEGKCCQSWAEHVAILRCLVADYRPPGRSLGKPSHNVAEQGDGCTIMPFWKSKGRFPINLQTNRSNERRKVSCCVVLLARIRNSVEFTRSALYLWVLSRLINLDVH